MNRPPTGRRNAFDVMQDALIDMRAEVILKQALSQMHCNQCGHRGLHAKMISNAARAAGEKRPVVCDACEQDQWKPCTVCAGSGKSPAGMVDGMSDGRERSDCGGTGTGKPAASNFRTFDGKDRR